MTYEERRAQAQGTYEAGLVKVADHAAPTAEQRLVRPLRISEEMVRLASGNGKHGSLPIDPWHSATKSTVLTIMNDRNKAAPPVPLSRLVVLEYEPQDAGEYLWRNKPTDPWRKVRQYWREDMLHEGWFYKIVKFHDSGEVVDARRLPEGEWAIQHNTKVELPPNGGSESKKERPDG